MKYPPSLLDEIRARLPVSSVVGRKVALKKAGREWRGLSPFKAEKTPSFFVNDQKGFYHCFASGEHGDIFRFLMETEGLTFPEAVERLAEEAGVTLPKWEPKNPEQRRQIEEQQDERTRLYALLEASAAFFQASLAGAAGSEARHYVETKRGLGRAAISGFRLGYAPGGRMVLRQHLTSLGFSVPDMIASGMLIGGDDIPEPYDRFRNRVMFPITDLKGRVIAFGGRALDPDAPAKYLNSPETPLFHKGSVLFNAAGARAPAHSKGRVIAVEGYMDVVALAEAGFAESVAPLGTALTEDQVKLLWRMADEPILCFDGDSAGRKAAWRAIDTVLPHLAAGRSVRFAFLPDGLDPDDLVRREGPAAIEAVLAATRPLLDVLWEREWGSEDWSTPERRARLDRRLADLVAAITDNAVRSHYSSALRDRLFNAWRQQGARDRGDQRPGRSAGPMRRGSNTGNDQGRRGNFQRNPGAYGNQPQAMRGAASSSLRNSRLGSSTAGLDLGPREALILRALLNHPWLLDEHCERLSALPFASRSAADLRDAMLEAQAGAIPLDSGTLRAHLTRSGFERVVSQIEQSSTHRVDKFAEPGSDRACVEAGWLHAIRLHDSQVGLRHALDAAEKAWLAEPNEDTLARITEIKRLLTQPIETGDGSEVTPLG